MLWLDRKNTVGDNSPSTHAFVIGVSHYDIVEENPSKHRTFGINHLDCAALSALQFARWLRDDYNNAAAPLSTIRMLLSPSVLERGEDPDLNNWNDEHSPSTESVTTELELWRNDCRRNLDNVAIFYVCGHGGMFNRGKRLLLLKDFAKHEQVLNFSINVDKVISGFAENDIAQTQFYFVDCCSVRLGNGDDIDLGDGVGLTSAWGPSPRASSTYFASTCEEEAYGDPGEATVFMQALLRSVSGEGVVPHLNAAGNWTVTAQSLGTTLTQLVASLEPKQRITTHFIGNPNFHVIPGSPKVSRKLHVSPEEGAEKSDVIIRDNQATTRMKVDRPFAPSPREIALEAGIYLVDVVPSDKYNPRTNIGFDLIPSLGAQLNQFDIELELQVNEK